MRFWKLYETSTYLAFIVLTENEGDNIQDFTYDLSNLLMQVVAYDYRKF